MIKPVSIQGYLQDFNQQSFTVSDEERDIIEVIHIWYTEGFKILSELKGIEIANKEQYLQIQENLVEKYDLTLLSLLNNKHYRTAFENILQKLKRDDAKVHLENLLLLASASKNSLQ
ncbi:hypothetical protein JCM19231_5771 [Vibrio ishigakensis]|uniref:Uncharacterized protein n=1 Tax=Vibrio ishigakensis TaxID=1481914 RepID=A0A0B8NT04_9VIBR|nr:hypothetical protein [Vibrio ishigakensis]GAM57695.1 hypothetical protein JCM19231_5771 [Vibrio ishigakensis]